MPPRLGQNHQGVDQIIDRLRRDQDEIRQHHLQRPEAQGDLPLDCLEIEPGSGDMMVLI
jgi:hypothetical protein